VLVLLLNLFFRYPRLRPGTLTLVYFCAYSVGRFFIEGLRTDSLMFGSFRIAQVVSVVGLAVGIGGLLWLYYWRRNLPDVVPADSRYNRL
jgi:phosphatidylglycerol:prolipoprotein diacylglycerol transferase